LPNDNGRVAPARRSRQTTRSRRIHNRRWGPNTYVTYPPSVVDQLYHLAVTASAGRNGFGPRHVGQYAPHSRRRHLGSRVITPCVFPLCRRVSQHERGPWSRRSP
jgi:hypothetical protein